MTAKQTDAATRGRATDTTVHVDQAHAVRAGDRTTIQDHRPRKVTLVREKAAENRTLLLAAGALGLGALAMTAIRRAMAARQQQPKNTAATAPGHSGRLPPVPLASEATPEFPASATQPKVVTVEVTEVEVAVVAPRPDEPAARPAGFGATPRPDPVPDRSAETAEHVPTDLMGDRPVSKEDRAIDAFRPDPTAPVPDAMRESLRPATGPAPSLVSDRGTFAQGLSQTDGSK